MNIALRSSVRKVPNKKFNFSLYLLGLMSTNSTGSSPSKIGSKFSGHPPPLKGTSCFGTSREELAPRDDEIQALRDETQASKEVIAILRKQIDELQREKDTL